MTPINEMMRARAEIIEQETRLVIAKDTINYDIMAWCVENDQSLLTVNWSKLFRMTGIEPDKFIKRRAFEKGDYDS